MEVGILSLIFQGGWVASIAFLLYLLLKFEKRLESLSSEMKKLEEKLEGYQRGMRVLVLFPCLCDIDRRLQ